MNRFLIGSAIAVSLVAGAAVAQDQAADKSADARAPHGWARMLAKVDTNKDGAVSLDEMLTAAKARFAKQDANNDGKITQDEAMAWRQQHHKMMAGNDGGPGFEGRHRGWRGRGGPDGPGGFGGPGGPGGPRGPGGMVAHLDADHDGKLTRAEFDAPFDRMDANHDGVVDQTEMKTAREAMQARFQQMRDGDGRPDAAKPDTGK